MAGYGLYQYTDPIYCTTGVRTGILTRVLETVTPTGLKSFVGMPSLLGSTASGTFLAFFDLVQLFLPSSVEYSS